VDRLKKSAQLGLEIRALLGELELKNHNRELEFEGLAKADCVNQCADFARIS
jgi:hypothetical protein